MIRGLDEPSPKSLLKQSGRCLPKGRSLCAGSSVDIPELRKQHVLSSNQMSEHITYLNLLLEILEEAQRTDFERVIAGDE
jgi:hypothetical protein